MVCAAVCLGADNKEYKCIQCINEKVACCSQSTVISPSGAVNWSPSVFATESRGDVSDDNDDCEDGENYDDDGADYCFYYLCYCLLLALALLLFSVFI